MRPLYLASIIAADKVIHIHLYSTHPWLEYKEIIEFEKKKDGKGKYELIRNYRFFESLDGEK